MKTIENQTFDMERALYGSRDVEVKNCRFDGPADGESAFKECSNVRADHCFFNLRYPFWHDHGLRITDSEMTEMCRAALWYTENVTFENCKIIGTQPLCYCRNLKLADCEMIDTDLAFERSEVEARITTPVISIKNPYAGYITVPEVGEIIRDDENAKGVIETLG